MKLSEKDYIDANVLCKKLTAIAVTDAGKQGISSNAIAVAIQGLQNAMLLNGMKPEDKAHRIQEVAYDLDATIRAMKGQDAYAAVPPEDKASEYIQSAIMAAGEIEQLGSQQIVYSMTVAMACCMKALEIPYDQVGYVSTNITTILETIDRADERRRSLN